MHELKDPKQRQLPCYIALSLFVHHETNWQSLLINKGKKIKKKLDPSGSCPGLLKSLLGIKPLSKPISLKTHTDSHTATDKYISYSQQCLEPIRAKVGGKWKTKLIFKLTMSAP